MEATPAHRAAEGLLGADLVEGDVALDEAPQLSAAYEVIAPWFQSPEPSERVIAAKCAGLLAGYHQRWRNAPYLIEEVERVVESDLFNPATDRRSRTFRAAGKIDIIATEETTGRRVIFDHKTTSEDIADANGAYWRQLVIEGQATHYMLIEWLNGHKLDYALWDVIRKPSIAPKQVTTKRDKEAIYHSKSYCGATLWETDMDEFLASERETPRMYAARLIQDCTETRPEWYFQRRQIPRLDAEILEYASELWGHTQDLIISRRENRWPRNSGACMLYGAPCKFLGICSGHDSIESGQWTKRDWVHPELPLIGVTNGNEFLTNSRIRTFQTCRQKHYLQYELGIERIDAQEREALVFGLKLHEALEAYFLELREQQRKRNGNSYTDASVSGIEPSGAQEVFAY